MDSNIEDTKALFDTAHDAYDRFRELAERIGLSGDDAALYVAYIGYHLRAAINSMGDEMTPQTFWLGVMEWDSQLQARIGNPIVNPHG